MGRKGEQKIVGLFGPSSEPDTVQTYPPKYVKAPLTFGQWGFTVWAR